MSALSPEEYALRKQFVQELSSLTTAELIEIVRILRKHKFVYSENTNGVFFNVATVPQTLFNELNTFIQFTKTNRTSIEDRNTLFSTLGVEPLSEKEKADVAAIIEDNPALAKGGIRPI
jgi:hypothetical protein